MKKYDFILCYDIANPKRLKKIAKAIEKKALRIQYSIFVLFQTTQKEVTILLKELTDIYNEKEDDIRVYKIKHKGFHFGSAIDLEKPYDFF